MAVVNTGLSRSVFLCIMHGRTRREPQRARTRNELQATHPVRGCADPRPHGENRGRNFTVGHRGLTSLTPGMLKLGGASFRSRSTAASRASRRGECWDNAVVKSFFSTLCASVSLWPVSQRPIIDASDYGASPVHRPVIAASMHSRVEPNQA